MRHFLLSSSRMFFAPENGSGGGGSSFDSRPNDDLHADVLAAFEEVESGGGDGAQELGDGRGAPGEQGKSRDGVQEKAEPGKGSRREPGERDERGANDPEKSVDAGRDRRTGDGRRPSADSREPQGAAADTGGAAPPSFSPRSKLDWERFKAAFPHIAADIGKREGEVGQGFAALRDYKDLKPYVEMATASGTTLSAALHRYTNLETLARRNPVQGVISICQGLQMSQVEAADTLLRAAQLLGARVGVPDRNGARTDVGNGSDQKDVFADPLVQSLRPVLQPLLETMAAMDNRLKTYESADRNAKEATLDSAITTFAADPKNVFFSELEDTITRLFETKMVPLTGNHAVDLQTAYEMAANIVPEVREALIEQRLSERGGQRRSRDQEIADRARRASRSLAGSGAADVEREPANAGRREFKPGQKPTDDIHADVAAAYDMVAGQAAY